MTVLEHAQKEDKIAKKKWLEQEDFKWEKRTLGVLRK
jgi:hypothetical protein